MLEIGKKPSKENLCAKVQSFLYLTLLITDKFNIETGKKVFFSSLGFKSKKYSRFKVYRAFSINPGYK
jgi:hypothetical protein